MQDQVRSRLISCGPGQQFQVLNHTLKPDSYTLWATCMEVKRDLWMAFQNFYPMCRLQVFGSTVMGVAFKDSDFDFFVELSPEPLTATPASVIEEAMNILQQNGKFANFLPISNARVPILKCYHIRTGYQCDINFSDPYGILNSPIVARLLRFDDRIYGVATILKYWAKVHDCAGKHRISNYALMWMLLFYLQQGPNPIMPPIIEFQKRVPSYNMNGYNFAFDESLQNQTTNRSQCSKLLREFFKFYSEFEYETQIICPLFGKAFQKSNVFAKNVPELSRYYEMLSMNQHLLSLHLNKRICIQDPFEITHSIPGVIKNSEFQNILWKFEYAAEIIDSELRSSGESTQLLLSLFDADKFTQYTEQKLQHNNTGTTQSQNSSTLKTTFHVKPTDYHLSFVSDILTTKHAESNTKIDRQTIYRTWSAFVVEFIFLILRDIFMLKIENIPFETTPNGTESPSTSAVAESSNENSTNSTTTSDDEKDKFVKVLNVSGNCDVFHGRKRISKFTTQSLHAEMLESQARVKKDVLDIRLKATVRITTDINSFDNILIQLEDQIKTKKKNHFKTFSMNFHQNIRNLLKIYFLHRSCNCAFT